MFSDEWLLRWWTVCAKQPRVLLSTTHDAHRRRSTNTPSYSKSLLDILLIPASAVPSEEAFSSARQTTTWERNRLSPGLIRCLQILKHHNRSLGWSEDRSLWASTEPDINVISARAEEDGEDD